MNNQLSDSLVSDLTMTLRFYHERSHSSVELEELLNIAEHLLDGLSTVRCHQVMRAHGNAPSETLNEPLEQLIQGGGNA